MKKEKQIIIRIDIELFESYKKVVELKRTTMSHEIRQFIITKVLESTNELS